MGVRVYGYIFVSRFSNLKFVDFGRLDFINNYIEVWRGDCGFGGCLLSVEVGG